MLMLINKTAIGQMKVLTEYTGVRRLDGGEI